jgi:hypothetical protein
MKKLSCGETLAVIAATILIVSGGVTLAQGTMPQHKEGMMDMSAMKLEPHHVLAMAYRDNLVTFAKALRQQAGNATTVTPEFAGAAVAEMRRSFDQMQQHHQEHMKTMSEPMKSHMSEMIQKMDTHKTAVEEHLGALEKEVQAGTPDGARVSEHIAEVLKHCDAMSTMNAGTTDHKMAGPKDHKMK